MRKFPIVELSYRRTIGAGVTFNLTGWFGLNVRRMRGSDERMYLCAIGWFPRGINTLGYYRLSCRSI